VTVQLSNPTTQPVTVPFTLSGTAANPADHDLSAGSFVTPGSTKSPGTTTATKTIQIVSDALDEPNETIVVTLGTATNASFQGLSVQTLTIQDDDASPSLSINDLFAPEAGGAASFTVSLSAASGQAVQVTASTVDQSAQAGADYTAVTSLVMTIPAGQTSASLPVTILDDNLAEPNERFLVRLSAPQNASLLDPEGAGTITDDEVSVSIGSVSRLEGAGGATTSFGFPILLSRPAPADVTVLASTSDDTAIAGVDYTGLSNQPITIPAGSTQALVPVTVNDENLNEPLELFRVTISGLTGGGGKATIGTNTGTGIIENDDTVAISVDDPSAPENVATGRLDFTVSLSNPSVGTIALFAATQDGSALAASGDYMARSNVLLSFAPGQTSKTVSVTLADDAINERDESLSLLLSGLSGGFGSPSFAKASGQGTIANDDLVTFGLANASIPENLGGSQAFAVPARITVTLSKASDAAVSFNVDTIGGTATPGLDFAPISALQITIPAGQTSAVLATTIFNERFNESDETFSLQLSSISGNPGVGPGVTLAVTITNDDDYDIVETIAGGFNLGAPANKSPFTILQGKGKLAVDSSGNVFVSEPSSASGIRRIDGQTGTVSAIVGPGLGSNLGDGGLAAHASIQEPTALTLDGAGNLYIAEDGFGLAALRRVDAQSGVINTVIDSPSTSFFAQKAAGIGDGGPLARWPDAGECP